jgi:hypothetical protein
MSRASDAITGVSDEALTPLRTEAAD